MRSAILVVVLVMVVAAPARAGKKCESADARKAVVEGKTQYDLGHYREAIALWEKVYVVCPSAGLLFNLAQANRMLGNNEEAITLYRSWLRESTDADPKVRREVEDRVAELAALIAAQRNSAEKPPTGVSDSDPGATGDAGGGGNAAAGGDTGAGGRDATTGGATGGSSTDGMPPDRSADVRPWHADRWGWVLVAGGVVALGTGGGLLLHASGLRDDALANPDAAEGRDQNASADTFRTTGYIFLAAGAAITAGGIIKLVLRDRPATRSAVEVSVGPTWVGVVGRF